MNPFRYTTGTSLFNGTLDVTGPMMLLAAGACWWDRELPPGHGSAVVAWLHRHALLEPVP